MNNANQVIYLNKEKDRIFLKDMVHEKSEGNPDFWSGFVVPGTEYTTREKAKYLLFRKGKNPKKQLGEILRTIYVDYLRDTDFGLFYKPEELINPKEGYLFESYHDYKGYSDGYFKDYIFIRDMFHYDKFLEHEEVYDKEDEYTQNVYKVPLFVKKIMYDECYPYFDSVKKYTIKKYIDGDSRRRSLIRDLSSITDVPKSLEDVLETPSIPKLLRSKGKMIFSIHYIGDYYRVEFMQ